MLYLHWISFTLLSSLLIFLYRFTSSSTAIDSSTKSYYASIGALFLSPLKLPLTTPVRTSSATSTSATFLFRSPFSLTYFLAQLARILRGLALILLRLVDQL